jgi:hypothetical protein
VQEDGGLQLADGGVDGQGQLEHHLRLRRTYTRFVSLCWASTDVLTSPFCQFDAWKCGISEANELLQPGTLLLL